MIPVAHLSMAAWVVALGNQDILERNEASLNHDLAHRNRPKLNRESPVEDLDEDAEGVVVESSKAAGFARSLD